ncbi:MAG: M14 family metallocarboxypeptidase [Ideonella sp.]
MIEAPEIQAPEVGPTNPRVAARFPAPSVQYRTPGLEPGRTRFTTDSELHSEMAQLERQGDEVSGRATVRLLVAGSSQRGVPIEALLFAGGRDVSPQTLRDSDRPTVMFIAGQHGDEPAPSEAMLVLARQLADGPLQALLRQVNVVIVPRVNPDGALRAQRMTANGIDSNRDQLLLRTPEARALARLILDYRPTVVVDCHEFPAVGDWQRKFGVVRRSDVLFQYAMTANMAEFVSRASEEWFREPLLKSLATARLSVDWYHYLVNEGASPVVTMGGTRPDTSRNVNGLRQAISLLIETRGSDLGRRDLQRRVHGQIVSATSILQSAVLHASDLRKLRSFVDSDVSAKACKGSVAIEAATTPSEYDLTAIDPNSGADRLITVNWQSALQLRTLRSRPRPCGYWLAANQTEAVVRLRLLGVNVIQFPERVSLRGETYRVLTTAWRDSPVSQENADSGYAQPVPVELQPALIDADVGSFFVPLTQPMANLAVAALEPDSPSSYLAHGIIDGADSVARTTVLPSVRISSMR